MGTLSLVVRFEDDSTLSIGPARRVFEYAVGGWRSRRPCVITDAAGQVVDAAEIGGPPDGTAGQTLHAALSFASADADRHPDGWSAAHEADLTVLGWVMDDAVTWASRARNAQPREAWSYAAWLVGIHGVQPIDYEDRDHLRAWADWSASVISAAVYGTDSLALAEVGA